MDSRTERIKKAMALLSEEFDTICIVATRHNFDKDETERYVFNYGNRYAVECSVLEVADSMNGGIFSVGIPEEEEDNG